MTRIAVFIAAFTAVLMLSNCSVGFDSEWRKSLADDRGVTRRDLTGPWQGTWLSEGNGHHGDLRCIVSHTDSSPAAAAGDQFRFHYHATFMKTLSATYDVTHQVKKTKEGFSFSGDQTLTGMGGGLYHYEGHGTPEEFSATFRSGSDHGVFELKRP